MDGGGSTPKAVSKEVESTLAGTEQEDLSTKVRDLEIALKHEREVAEGYKREVDNMKADLHDTQGQLKESRANCRQLTEALVSGTGSRETGIRHVSCKVSIRSTPYGSSFDGILLLDSSGQKELEIKEHIAQQIGLVCVNNFISRSIPMDLIISAGGIPSEGASKRGPVRIDLCLGDGSEQSNRYNQPKTLEVWTEKKSRGTEFSHSQTLRVVCRKGWTPVKDPNKDSEVYSLIIGEPGMSILGLELRSDGQVFKKRV